MVVDAALSGGVAAGVLLRAVIHDFSERTACPRKTFCAVCSAREKRKEIRRRSMLVSRSSLAAYAGQSVGWGWCWSALKLEWASLSADRCCTGEVSASLRLCCTRLWFAAATRSSSSVRTLFDCSTAAHFVAECDVEKCLCVPNVRKLRFCVC